MQQRHKSQREHHLSPKSSLQPHTAGLTAGPDLPGHTCEHSDIDHVLMINGSRIQFTKSEYRLLMLILEHVQDDYVSYTDIARIVYQRELNDDLLPPLRKRISSLRSKIADYGIDIVNVPYRGYKASTFSRLSLPYRRGYRAKQTRTRFI
jgi:DNA-binding response OmpR family regulator